MRVVELEIILEDAGDYFDILQGAAERDGGDEGGERGGDGGGGEGEQVGETIIFVVIVFKPKEPP